jgi:PAS domain S-box-containing protein
MLRPELQIVSGPKKVDSDRKIKALVVEDSPTQAKLLSISLGRLGVNGEWVCTLAQAFERLAQHDIDVILLDLFLPDSSGIDTFYRVHAFDSTLPIVVLTGLDDQNIALAAVKGGAQEYLVKGRASEDSIVRCLRYAIERNHAEQTLRETERRTRLIIENSLDAFIAMDKQGHILDWNRHAEEMFGFRRHDTLGKSINEIISPNYIRKTGQRIDLEKILTELKDRPQNDRIEVLGVDRDGNEFPMEVGLFRVEDKQGTMFCAFINDITERKEIEQKRRKMRRELERRVEERTLDLQRSNEELQQFAKIASHDLQEPLRAVQGFANLFAKRYKGKLDKDADDFIDFILDGTARMQQLIEAVLEHSKIQPPGKDTPVTNVNSVLVEVLANLSQSIAESGAEIKKMNELPSVRMARTHLIQLFQNLIGNAIKYRGEAAPQIFVSSELNVDEWLFTVRDNGIGIDPRYAEKVFDMFARLQGRTVYKGTGMGLAICKKIVSAHGGNIWMESEPGQGSIFFFTIPSEVQPKEETDATTN